MHSLTIKPNNSSNVTAARLAALAHKCVRNCARIHLLVDVLIVL